MLARVGSLFFWGRSSVWLEHLLCKQRVNGSNPFLSTLVSAVVRTRRNKRLRLQFYGCVAQLVKSAQDGQFSVEVACSSHVASPMNEDKIAFVYIAGKQHGRVLITKEQYKQVLDIIYGKKEA